MNTATGTVQSIVRIIKYVFLLAGFLLVFNNQSYSQGLFKAGGKGDSDRIEGKFKFIPLPYIDYHRAIGWSFGALPIGMYNLSEKDTLSPSSMTGLFGMYTTNDTWFAMGFGRMFLNEDRWRITYAAGIGNINYQFFVSSPINQWIKYNTNADFAYIGVQRRVIPKLYGGVNYIFTSFDTETDVFEGMTTLHGAGLSATWDARSNVSYPRSGYYLETKFTTYPDLFGNEQVSNRIEVTYNHFFSTRKETDVIATRFYSGLGIGDVNFNQQFIVGGTDIRGYSFGEFRGNYLIAAQAEYRYNFYKRFGAVGFAGIASVFESNVEENDGKIIPGGGFGLRYTYLPDTHGNVGFDIAWGEGDWGIYFRFSEAF